MPRALGLEIVMAVCRSIEVHREPVGRRVKAAVVLAETRAATSSATWSDQQA
ncbi:hypothetical protein ACIGO8_30735 [Streptomyces sp. NPDC053493]|uniref:hypothetical protein n=1 Tax=Streptomyces sp. NPDC053493 TaxID=3365705 RepID=UPI0037D1CF38